MRAIRADSASGASRRSVGGMDSSLGRDVVTVYCSSQQCEWHNGDGMREGEVAKKWAVVRKTAQRSQVARRGGFVDDRREMEVAGDWIEFSLSASILGRFYALPAYPHPLCSVISRGRSCIFYMAVLFLSNSQNPTEFQNKNKSSKSLQKGIAQGTPYQRASSADRLSSTHRLQARVHFDQVHGHQVAGLVDTLTDEVALTQSQAATDWGTGAGSPLRVQRIDVEREVDGSIIANVSESHLDNATDAVTVMRKEIRVSRAVIQRGQVSRESQRRNGHTGQCRAC